MLSLVPGLLTPLNLVSLSGDTEIASLLLGARADVNLSDNKGQTPVYKAACKGHTEMVEMLLKAGARVEDPY